MPGISGESEVPVTFKQTVNASGVAVLDSQGVAGANVTARTSNGALTVEDALALGDSETSNGRRGGAAITVRRSNGDIYLSAIS